MKFLFLLVRKHRTVVFRDEATGEHFEVSHSEFLTIMRILVFIIMTKRVVFYMRRTVFPIWVVCLGNLVD